MRNVVIIGGGIAGLTAATYLGRFRRPVLVIDGHASRARWIPESHNIPGFPDGVGGEELLSRLKSQAQKYGAEVIPGCVRSIVRHESSFVSDLGENSLESRYVLMATGVADHLPDLQGATEALQRSVLRVCPICDGFEAVDKKIAVLGDGERGEREAQFLRTYSADVCYLHLGPTQDATRPRRLTAQGIAFLEIELEQLRIEENHLTLSQPPGVPRVFDVVYAALGCSPRIELAQALGALCDDNHALRVSAHQQTSVDGLYAAGDNVRGLNQVIVAAAEAAIAATDIHNRLRQAGY